MAHSPALMRGVLARLELDPHIHPASTLVQLETADEAGRTDIEILTPTGHAIIEAKQGWIVPGEIQLTAYTPRLNEAANAGLATRLVTLSDSTAAWAREVLPAQVAGVEVTHWSWDDVRELITAARAQVRGTERLWLGQLEDYMGSAPRNDP